MPCHAGAFAAYKQFSSNRSATQLKNTWEALEARRLEAKNERALAAWRELQDAKGKGMSQQHLPSCKEPALSVDSAAADGVHAPDADSDHLTASQMITATSQPHFAGLIDGKSMKICCKL